jgi:hypothetical protein
MRKELIIVSSCEETQEGFDPKSLSTATYESPAQAKETILNTLRAESSELGEEYGVLSGDIADMFSTRWNGGAFSYRIGGHEYHYRWTRIPGEYKVTDDELVKALDAFGNSNRSRADYGRVARRISSETHRYIQNELWKFVKELIRAFAEGGCDERNRTARNQARILESVIETDPEF